MNGLRQRMMDVGEELLIELAHEEKLSQCGSRHADDAAILAEWKDSRIMIETLALKYAAAITGYRNAMEQAIPAWPKRHS
jgi:hypothetical protein